MLYCSLLSVTSSFVILSFYRRPPRCFFAICGEQHPIVSIALCHNFALCRSASCGKRPNRNLQRECPESRSQIHTLPDLSVASMDDRRAGSVCLTVAAGWSDGSLKWSVAGRRVDRTAAPGRAAHPSRDGRFPFPSGPVRSSVRPSVSYYMYSTPLSPHGVRLLSSSRQSRRWHQSRIKCGLAVVSTSTSWSVQSRHSSGSSTVTRTTTVLAPAQVRRDETQYY